LFSPSSSNVRRLILVFIKNGAKAISLNNELNPRFQNQTIFSLERESEMKQEAESEKSLKTTIMLGKRGKPTILWD